MVEWKTDGKCSFRVMSDRTTFTAKMADAYTKGNERERELLIIGWNEAMAQTEAEIEKLRAALKPFADMVDYCTGTKDDDWMDAVFKLGEVRAAAAALKETGDES